MPTKVDLPDPFQIVLRRLTRKYPAIMKELNILIENWKQMNAPVIKLLV
jgi:hypothetical protein